jgi:hypothetical protein
MHGACLIGVELFSASLGGHWVYDENVAHEVRARLIGEKFRDNDK